MELADGLGPEPGDLQELDEARRDLGPQPLVEGEAAGRGELGELVADRLADARDARRIPGPVGRHEVDRAPSDRIGGAVVGDDLEPELTLELEHVADLVEDPGKVAVGQCRLVGGHRPDGRRLPGRTGRQAATTRSRPAFLAR